MPTLNGIKVASRVGNEFPPEEKIAMLAEVEAEDRAKNPTPDVDEAHFSRAQGDSPAMWTVSSDTSLDGIIEESAAFTKENIQKATMYVDTGTTATEKGLPTAESDDVLMDDIAIETSGTPKNTTGQTIEEESENGDDGESRLIGK
ncbi:hypothetical protein E4U60_006221 [Claviceps pazoutovae]|uniref:Uncharacterized protein n=1 Tax=Claviceps pazoutovae TaxID=1649127 RepID=A0A9P7M6Y4_9HYPO|nr:hypothetical protein E4U60_006221 [Claviceps pazoutovae]